MPLVLFILAGSIVWSYLGSDSSKSEPEINRDTQTYQNNSYQSYGSYDEDYTSLSDPENPYDEGTGHYAGYEWAEENEVDDCGGNSESFIEGCEEYVSQRDESNDYEE